jgi:uncharacterized membrane protein YvbJ
MVYCQKCGAENEDNAVYCKECGEKLGVKVVERVVIEKEPKNNDIGAIWFIIGVVLPLVGIIAGLIFAAQRRKNAGLLILVSLIIPVLVFLLIVYQAYFQY